jgi:hypothetical protein
MKKLRAKDVLPEFPRTVILPHKPNGTADDIITTNAEAKVVFQSHYVHIEEKIDGASVGMGILDGHPVVRSRRNILRKGSTKGQFASLWNWWYDHRERFDELADMGPFSIYGEWMWAEHSVRHTGEVDDYNQLESLANLPAKWADGPAEGIYIKVYNPEVVEYRFKLVREGFVHRQDWNPKEFTRNERA